MQKTFKITVLLLICSILSVLFITKKLNEKSLEFMEKQKPYNTINQCEQYKRLVNQKSAYNFGSLTIIRPDNCNDSIEIK